MSTFERLRKFELSEAAEYAQQGAQVVIISPNSEMERVLVNHVAETLNDRGVPVARIVGQRDLALRSHLWGHRGALRFICLRDETRGAEADVVMAAGVPFSIEVERNASVMTATSTFTPKVDPAEVVDGVEYLPIADARSRQQTIWTLVERELARQESKGYTIEHDAKHTFSELIEAGKAFEFGDARLWPWSPELLHLRGALWNLVRASAMYAAAYNHAKARDNRPEARCANILGARAGNKIERLLEEVHTSLQSRIPS